MGHALRRIGAAVVAIIALCIYPSLARAEGTLYLAREPDKSFPLTRTDVQMDVAGEIVSTTVTQKFQNAFKERVEVVYVFPLPAHAAVDDMEMHLGPRVVRAEIKKRVEAQAMYDAAARHGQRAALLEQERPNVFTFSVANVDPGGEIEVKLHYFELAAYDHGTYEAAFPMVVGPRYVPGRALPGAQSGTGTRTDTDRVPDASRISPAYVPPSTRSGHTIGVRVRLDAGAPLETLESPSHDVATVRGSASLADVTLRDLAEIPNRDFVLRWRLAANELRTAVFTHKADAREDGYLAVLLEPKHDPSARDIAPRELFFLLDTSGSMRGTPLAAAVDAVLRAIDTMQPSDTFQIVDFADRASSFAPRPLANTRENVQRAHQYLRALRGSGGTNQLAGIHAALSAPGDASRLRFVMFMTDGYIGNEQAVVSLVKREIGGARIFGFGVGSSVNRYLLDEVSYVGRGTAEYLRPREDAKELVDRFYERIGKPYLTDIQLDWGGLPVGEVVPARMRDLSAFSPAIVLARYTAGGRGALTLRGKIGGRPFEQRIELTLPDRQVEHEAIPRVWAREKIGELSRGKHQAENQNAITEIALAHHLVSPFTALVAIDDAPGDANGFPLLLKQPNEAPEGVDLGSAGGVYATPAEPTATTVTPAPPPPSPAYAHGGEADSEVYAARAPRGCGGCVTAPRTAGRDVWLSLGVLGALALLRFRRRARRTDP